MSDREVHRGARVYSPTVLGIYDLLVIRFCNAWVWRCPSSRMLTPYASEVGPRHLDVGPGTGWYLARARFPAQVDVVLMDLNLHSLDRAAGRIPEVPYRTLVGDVLAPLPADAGPFDSIAANYLLHCVPGSWAEKGVAFGHLADRLADDGVLFGATILGSGVDHSLAGRGLMGLYNRLGIFHNRGDDAAGLRAALGRAFLDVDVEVVGTVALFTARGPRRRRSRS